MSNFVFTVFFFKQKSAYEMRISDWSSDVCSSDLQLRAIRDRFRDPPVQPRGLFFGDHRADESLAVLGIARDQRLRLFDEHGAEFVVTVGVDDDPLDPDARLTRLIEGAEDDPRERMIEVGVLVDDNSGLAAALRPDLFSSRLSLPY